MSLIAGTSSVSRVARGWALDQNCKSIHTYTAARGPATQCLKRKGGKLRRWGWREVRHDADGQKLPQSWPFLNLKYWKL